MLASCADAPDIVLLPPDGAVDTQTSTALAWVGVYEGWGTVTVDGTPTTVQNMAMRITFDADSVRRSITLHRFSGAGDISNALVVTIRQEEIGPLGT